MKHWRKELKRIAAAALAVMMIGTTVDVSALAVLAAEEVAEVTCNHVCNEACGGMQAATEGALTTCTHVHDEECGYEEETEDAVCTCETDDSAFHATNCPAYIAPENPECTCVEKCTDDTLNVWCDVCGVQGVSACQGTDTAAIYAETPDFSTAKVLTAVDGALCIDGDSVSTMPAGNYKLTGDIATDTYIRTEGSINLDLNGYTWDMSAKYLFLDENVTLSLYDTSVNKTGKITSSFNKTISLNGSGSTFNLYSGTVENTSDNVNAHGVSSNYGSSNLYGGTIKSNAYAVFYYLSQNITINIDNTSFDCGAGYAQIYTSLDSNGEPCAVIDVSDYTGGALTVDAYIAYINKAAVIKFFTGIQSAQDAENYKVNVSCDDNMDFFMEKEEYNEETKEKYITVSVPSFTTQPAEENDYTVAFNHPDATLQWCEVTVYASATYSEEDEDHYKLYEVNAGDTLIVSVSERSDDFELILDCSYNDEYVSALLDSSRKTASVTFDSACSVGVNFLPSPCGTGEYKIEHVICTELNGETGNQLSKTECETTYRCKATVGETVYYSDAVTIEQEHNYTCTANDNVITKECTNCGKAGGTLTITAEGGICDGTTAYGATVEKTGIFENEEVTISYYQGDTLIGTDAPVNAGTYTAKITCEEVTVSCQFEISSATPTAEMFTYTAPANLTYDGAEKSANVVVKDGITGMGEITVKYYQNDIEVTPINAGTYTVKIDVAEGDNYDASTDIEVGTFEIGKATPTYDMFTATPSSDLVYDGTEKSIIVTTDKVGMGAFTVIYVSYTDSTQPVEAGYYIVRLHIEEGDNYIAVDTLSFDVFEIKKADSVISAAPTPIADLEYDGTAQILINAGTTTDGEMQYSLDGTNFSSAIPTGTDAKTYTVWYKVDGDKNHNDTTPASVEVTIAPKSVTVTADNASKTYGENDPTFAYTATGLEGSDTLTGTLSRETGENAGTYAITQGTLTNENNQNYDITFAEGTFTINKATPVSPETPEATAITYGDTLSSSVLDDSSWTWLDGAIVPDAYTDCNAYIEVDDSNYDYTGVNGYDSANHRVVRKVDVSISKATLTITAKSYTIKVGKALPTYDYTVTGLVGDDTLPVDVTVSCSVADSNTVGAYTITIAGEVSDNILASYYVINYVNGTLTISEKDTQEITADDVTLTYGETKNIGATTNGDGTITYATTSDVISVAADGTITALKAGTATVTISTAETDDYAAAAKTISVTVNKKKVAVPAVDTNGYIYTGTAQTYGVTSTDDYTVEGGVQTNAGEYPVTITLNNENYEWDGTLGTYKFVISKAAVTVTAKSYTIKAGDTLPTYAYDVTGLVNSETLPVDVAISCPATNSNTAGTYTITVSGAANSTNYTFAYVNGTLTVSNKLEQTITASDVTLAYGEAGKKISATTNGGGAISYTVATGTDVISVAADGTITVLKAGTATVTIRAAETADYAAAAKTISVTVNKAENAPNMPGATMNVSYDTETVGAVTLPDGWAWKAEDASKALTAGTAVTATAVYNGADKGNYETETVEVAITRSSGGSSGGGSSSGGSSSGGGYYPPYYPSYPVVTPTPVPTVTPTPTVMPTATPTMAPSLAPSATPTPTPVPGTVTVPSSGETVVDENGETVTSVVQEPGTKTKLSIPGLTDAEPEAGEEAAPVIWESSNPDVAEVDEEGNVTMKKPGMAEIVVTVGEGEDAKTETIVVLVEEPRTYVNPLEEAFKDVRLGTSWADIPLIRYQKVGETVDINFYGVKNWKQENYEYIWTSSDESVAKVDNKGRVTALKPGVVELTLGLKNKKDGHFLNVQSVEIVVPGDYENKILLGTSKNNTFDSIVLNLNERIDINFYGVKNWKKEEYEYYWSSSEPSVVWVDNLGRLVPVKHGKAEIFLVLIEKKNGAPRYVVPMEVTVPEK